MGADLNSVSLTCRLTRDPELRHTAGGTAVCNMRVAWTDREKQGGDWGDRSNFIDVTVWGKQGESAAQYLAKGRRIAIDGRLRWREWEANDGSKRQTIEITADQVVFLDYAEDGQSRMSDRSDYQAPPPPGDGDFGVPGQGEPRREADAEPAPLGASDFAPNTQDDDIPF